MIAHLKGTLVSKTPAEIILDVHGVGFRVNIPLSTFERLGSPGESVSILTHLHVREDAMQLFGFLTDAERELFRNLLSISGIGPKMAQGILSGLRPAELREAIVAGDIHALTSISGVGRKTAERIVLELRHSLGSLGLEEPAVVSTSAQRKIQSEAMVALMSLGYTKSNAEQALRSVTAAGGRANLSVEELLKLALQHAAKK